MNADSVAMQEEDIFRDYRRIRLFLVATYLVIATVVVGVSALFLWSERNDVLEQAVAQTGSLTRALEEHVLRTFDAVDDQLRATGRRLTEMRALERPSNAALVELLRREKPPGDHVRSMYAYDATGRGHTTSLGADIGGLHARDAEHFRAILESRTDKRTVGRVTGGPVTRRPSITIARGLLDQDGRFAGIIGAAIEPAYFAEFYRSLDLEPGASLALLRDDGALLARFPQTAGVPVSLVQTDIFRNLLARQPSGALDVRSVIDGSRRIGSFRHVRGWNLIVTNTQNYDVLMAPWQRMAWVVGALAAASLAVLLALLSFVLRELRRRAAAQSAHAEAALRALFDNSSEGILLFDGETSRFHSCNPALLRMLGYAEGELSRIPVYGIHPAEQQARFKEMYSAMQRGEIVTAAAIPTQRKDGTVFYLDILGLRLQFEGRRYFAALMRDVTATHSAQQALRVSHAAIESSINAISLTNLDGVITYANRAYLDLWRLDTLDMAVGHRAEEFVPDAQAIRERAMQDGNWIGETIGVRHDGSRVEVQVSLHVVKDDSGHPLCRMASFIDITDRKRAESDVLQLNAELERRVQERTAELQEVNADLETFSYSVAHDLKSPLRGIDGYSRLLLLNHASQLDEEGRKFLDNIVLATKHMGQLLEDLLAYSRLERRDLQVGPVDPQQVVESLLAECSGEIQSRGVAVTVDIRCRSVQADREGLTMALRNLIENALKFTRHAPNATVEIAGRDSGSTCIFSVRDNGVGFDMKFHDRIFDIFQRLQRSEDYPGTGVGLAIVKKAMERMNGRVWAESEPGKGATFYLEIPE
jgi:PAS domain S-box-containing protein